MASTISIIRGLRGSSIIYMRCFGTTGFYRHGSDVVPPLSGDHSSIPVANGAAPRVDFDHKNVEDLIMRSSRKDMPIDMTNPYEKKKVQCLLCKYKLELDYKNVKLLSQFVSSFTGNVYEKHITGLCQEQQDRLVKTIERSRNAGFMPKLFKKVEFFKDPKLFDPNNPIKPHPH